MEDKKMAKQSMDSSLGMLWYLAGEDDEEETYVFDMNEFPAIQIRNNFSSKSAETHESLYSTLNEKYDVIAILLKKNTSIEDDLFAYELGILKDSYFPCVEQPYDDLENGDLDIYEPRQCYDEYERMFAEAVILIDSRLVKLIDITLEQWLDLKFGDHKQVDKEIMEEVLTYDELSNLEEENLYEGNEIAEVFRIETDIFLFETPLCKEFKEFNHLLQIDVDNNKVSWVDEKSWLEDGIWMEPTDDICHECKSFGFKSGHVEWPTYYEWYEGLEDGDSKEETLKEKSILEGSWGHENRKGKNFCSWLKESFGNYHKLDYELMLKLEVYWWERKKRKNQNRTWINNDNDAIQANQELFDDHQPMKDYDDDDIGDLDDYLIQNDAPYYVNEEEERFKERRSKLLGIPYKKPPTFKSVKFEVSIRCIHYHRCGVLTALEVLNANEESGGMHIIWNLMCVVHAGIQTLFIMEDHTVPGEFSF
ncbi:hypothetical protein Tco_0577797 [Tanacetum coccineum]